MIPFTFSNWICKLEGKNSKIKTYDIETEIGILYYWNLKMPFPFICCQVFVCFYWKNYFIKLRRKKEVYVNVANQETFIHIGMRDSLQSTKRKLKKNVKIHTNPLLILAVILVKGNREQITCTSMNTKLFKIFIPQLTLISC